MPHKYQVESSSYPSHSIHHSPICIFICGFVMCRLNFQIRRSMIYFFLIKIHLLLSSIIVSQYCLIRYINSSLRNIFSNIIQCLVAIFSTSFFSTRLKMFNGIKLALIFEIIHHEVMFFISWLNNRAFNLTFLRFKVCLKWITISNTKFQNCQLKKIKILIKQNNYFD